MSTIIKNCKICHEIDLLKKWNRKDCKVIFTFTSHKYWKWGDLFCFEMHKNITHVNSWKQSIAQTTVDACSQEYSGTNSLILKKPSWKERGQQKLFWQNNLHDRKCKLNSTTCNSNQKWRNEKCQYECKNHHTSNKDHRLSPSICICNNSWYLCIDNPLTISPNVNTISTSITSTMPINSADKKSKK